MAASFAVTGNAQSPDPDLQTPWSRTQAVEEAADVLLPERWQQSGQISLAQRQNNAAAWLQRLDKSRLNLGEDAYLRSFVLYLTAGTRAPRDANAERMKAARVLADHVLAHNGLPESAAVYGPWIDRLLPWELDAALQRADFDRAHLLLITLLRAGSNPYQTCTTFGSKLLDIGSEPATRLLIALVSTALADDRLPVSEKNAILKYIYGQPALASTRATTPSPTSGRGEAGTRFVPFAGKDLDGNAISVDDFKGKVLLIDFWATWCGPCLKEMPNVVDAYDNYREQGLAILGVSLDQPGKAGQIKKVMKDLGMTWPQIYDGGYWKTEPAMLNNITAIPATILIDRRGVARFRDARGASLHEKIEQLLKEP